MLTRLISGMVLGGVFVNEGLRTQALWYDRKCTFERAQRRAASIQRPLVVVGDPDAGAVTRHVRAYSCGDICVDLEGCPNCPVSMPVDITKGLPGIADNSAVVFVSCVLEYTDDPEAALKEMRRIAGSEENLYVVTVSPHTMTSLLYPGAKWVFEDGRWRPISRAAQTVVAGGVVLAAGTLLASCFRKNT